MCHLQTEVFLQTDSLQLLHVKQCFLAILPIDKSYNGLFRAIIRSTDSVAVLHVPWFNINLNIWEDWCHWWLKVRVLDTSGMPEITKLFLLTYCSRVSWEDSIRATLFFYINIWLFSWNIFEENQFYEIKKRNI